MYFTWGSRSSSCGLAPAPAPGGWEWPRQHLPTTLDHSAPEQPQNRGLLSRLSICFRPFPCPPIGLRSSLGLCLPTKCLHAPLQQGSRNQSRSPDSVRGGTRPCPGTPGLGRPASPAGTLSFLLFSGLAQVDTATQKLGKERAEPRTTALWRRAARQRRRGRFPLATASLTSSSAEIKLTELKPFRRRRHHSGSREPAPMCALQNVIF